MTNELITKKMLIVAATYAELAPTFNQFGWSATTFVKQTGFDVLITGVGMTATAFALGQHLKTSYSSVLNVGIAGSFDKTIELGSLVNITEDTFSELGAEDGNEFIRIDDLGFVKSKYTSSFDPENELVNNLLNVNSITVNTVHGCTERIQQTIKRFNVKTESMEGAAVFYACEQLKIKALQIRCISNYIEKRDRENWKIDLAIKNLNDWLINYLNANFAV